MLSWGMLLMENILEIAGDCLLSISLLSTIMKLIKKERIQKTTNKMLLFFIQI